MDAHYNHSTAHGRYPQPHTRRVIDNLRPMHPSLRSADASSGLSDWDHQSLTDTRDFKHDRCSHSGTVKRTQRRREPCLKHHRQPGRARNQVSRISADCVQTSRLSSFGCLQTRRPLVCIVHPLDRAIDECCSRTSFRRIIRHDRLRPSSPRTVVKTGRVNIKRHTRVQGGQETLGERQRGRCRRVLGEARWKD